MRAQQLNEISHTKCSYGGVNNILGRIQILGFLGVDSCQCGFLSINRAPALWSVGLALAFLSPSILLFVGVLLRLQALREEGPAQAFAPIPKPRDRLPV